MSSVADHDLSGFYLRPVGHRIRDTQWAQAYWMRVEGVANGQKAAVVERGAAFGQGVELGERDTARREGCLLPRQRLGQSEPSMILGCER